MAEFIAFHQNEKFEKELKQLHSVHDLFKSSILELAEITCTLGQEMLKLEKKVMRLEMGRIDIHESKNDI